MVVDHATAPGSFHPPGIAPVIAEGGTSHLPCPPGDQGLRHHDKLGPRIFAVVDAQRWLRRKRAKSCFSSVEALEPVFALQKIQPLALDSLLRVECLDSAG